MDTWVMAGLLLAVLVALTSRVLFRRYQDFRIRQYRHRSAWREYRQRSRTGRWW